MLNVIDEIIEIDKNARKSIADANARAEEIGKQAELEAEKIRRDFNERIEKRLSIVRENYEKFAEDEIAAIIIHEKETEENLEQVMNEYGKGWSSEIINRITNRNM